MAAGVPAVVPDGPDGPAAPEGEPQRYVVVYDDGAALDDAHAALVELGAAIEAEQPEIGVATVVATRLDFEAAALAEPALLGAVADQPIGQVEVPRSDPSDGDIERLSDVRDASRGQALVADGPMRRALDGSEPLAWLQWDMAMIRADQAGSHARDPGTEEVVVGIVDSGIDGSHPDIAPNLDLGLSASFTTDIPAIDGDCAAEPDGSCTDPLDVDENGHGTHIAGIVAGAVNGVGIAGVAPRVRLANLRAGQDSGFFFAGPTIAALTWAADHGIDVVNLSFTLDPWLFLCPGHPLDAPAAQAEQRTITEAVQRALQYAESHDVTVVSSAGNAHMDLAHPTLDRLSPDHPRGAAYTRLLDPSCTTLPAQGHNVVAVASVGPTRTKADTSNYGLGVADLTAPGGFFLDRVGTASFRSPTNLVLSAYPVDVARARGDIDATGRPTTPFVVRDCGPTGAGPCSYYQYLQGTSMAAPHVAGVAALIVSHYGDPDPWSPGLRLAPVTVQRILADTATDLPCPDPPLKTYRAEGQPPEYDALCEGPPNRNGFAGEGLVDALRAVGG
jgi:subtilisin family serine protease